MYAEDADARIKALEKELSWSKEKSQTLDEQLHFKNMENEDHHA